MSVRKQVTVAAAVLHHEGRVLLTRRLSSAHLAGLWEFPGGKVEPGEAPAAAVVRECHEECGIAVVVQDILDVTFHAYPEKDLLLLFYACRFARGSEVVQHLGVADHVWALPSQLREHPMPPPDEQVIEKIERGELSRFSR